MNSFPNPKGRFKRPFLIQGGTAAAVYLFCKKFSYFLSVICMRTCNNRDLRGKGEREMRKEEGVPPPRRFFGDVLSAQKVTRPQAEYSRAAAGRPLQEARSPAPWGNSIKGDRSPPFGRFKERGFPGGEGNSKSLSPWAALW